MSYIGRHWRGEFSLPQSYWVNGVIVLMPFNIYFRVLEAAFAENPPQSPATFFEAFAIPFLVMIPIVIWSGVGIWRSAGRRIADGKPGWAWVARIVVLVNLLVLLVAMFTTVRYAYAMAQALQMESRATYKITDDGRYIVFHGTITDAAATELVAKLGNPKVQRFVINASNGGFLPPALRVARVIKDRKLFVVAMEQCESACTILLAAGQTRAIFPGTMMGFHRGTLVGLSDDLPQNKLDEKFYSDAGMSPALIARIRTHAGPTDLYDPPLRDLIDDGFLTDIFDESRQVYVSARAWCVQQPVLCAKTGRENWQAAHAQQKPQ